MFGVNSLVFWSLVAAVTSQLSQSDTYDYCDANLKLCDPPTEHTMCLFPDPKPSDRCSSDIQEPLSATEKKRILFWHNKFRSNVANGTERNKNRKLPTASNMRQIYWDKELETISSRWANQCVGTQDNVTLDKCRNTKKFLVSQNVGTRRVNGSSIDKQAPQMVISWYKESKNFDPTLIDEFVSLGDEKMSSKQFANIIWAETFALGCARVIFREKEELGEEAENENPKKQIVWMVERLVCNYGPAGNQVGKPIYKRGTSCTECPEGTKCSVVFPGLCAIQNDVKQENKTNFINQDLKEDVPKTDANGSAEVHEQEKDSSGDEIQFFTTSNQTETETETEPESESDESFFPSPKDAYPDEEVFLKEIPIKCHGRECWEMKNLDASGASGDVEGSSYGKGSLPSFNPNKIEEIMNSPKSSEVLLFEKIGKKATCEGRDCRIIINKNQNRTRSVGKVRKIIRAADGSDKSKNHGGLEEKDGKGCKCTEVIVSGGTREAHPSKMKFFFLVATLILELLINKQ